MRQTVTPKQTIAKPSQGEMAGCRGLVPTSRPSVSRTSKAKRAIRNPKPIRASEVRIQAKKVRSAAR